MSEATIPGSLDIWKLASYEETCSPRLAELGEHCGNSLRRLMLVACGLNNTLKLRDCTKG